MELKPDGRQHYSLGERSPKHINTSGQKLFIDAFLTGMRTSTVISSPRHTQKTAAPRRRSWVGHLSLRSVPSLSLLTRSRDSTLSPSTARESPERRRDLTRAHSSWRSPRFVLQTLTGQRVPRLALSCTSERRVSRPLDIVEASVEASHQQAHQRAT